MYFGVRPSKDQIVEMVDEIKTILGAPVETAYLCDQLGYWVRNSTLDGLVDELDAQVTVINNLGITVTVPASEHVEIHVNFGSAHGHYRRRFGIFPYTTRGLTQWSISHPNAQVASRLAREIRHRVVAMGGARWRTRNGISKWSLVSSAGLVPFAVFILSFATLDYVGLKDLYWGLFAVAILLWKWLFLALEYRYVKVRVRTPALITWWNTWNPSSVLVARATVIATVLAIPALILSLVSVFQG